MIVPPQSTAAHPVGPATFAAQPVGPATFAAVVDQLAQHGYSLRRAWPRSHDHLHLDLQPRDHRFLDPRGGPSVAAQWFADADRARETAAKTPGATRSDHVVWQPGGADRKLSSLADLLAGPGTELVGHRPERRAVLRVRGDTGSTGSIKGNGSTGYIKVVPRRRWAGTVAATRRAELLPLRTPTLLDGDERRGTIVTAALPGVPLHDLLGTDRALVACEATGAALARLHSIPVPDDLPWHDLESELAVTTRWEGLAAVFGASTDAVPLPPTTPSTPIGQAALIDRSGTRPRVVLHRDLHDKQVLVDEGGEVGMLDFDLMAVGDPALDLANLLAHLDLRVGQGVASDAAALRDAVLRGYAPTAEVLSAIDSYEALARRRIAAVYAFRSNTSVT